MVWENQLTMTSDKPVKTDYEFEMLECPSSPEESSPSEEAFETSGSKGGSKRRQEDSKKALDYKFVSSYQEGYPPTNGLRHQSSFAISINNTLDPDNVIIFATTGQNRVNIYKCEEDGSMVPKFSFVDPDAEEIFYCLDWSKDVDTTENIVAAAGLRGIIRILNIHQLKCTGSFIGHGHCVNDLKFHPSDPSLLLSCSKDHDIRLWNIKTSCNVASFGGLEGHRDEVLSVDFNHDGSMFISSSMDHSLKIWKLDKPKVKAAIQRSYSAPIGPMGNFNTEDINFPDFSTREIHSNYIDCCKWLGNLVISKSCENRVVIWKPGSLQKEDEVLSSTHKASAMRELEVENCEIWFVRFAICEELRIMALGNEDGKIFVWDLCSPDFTNIKFKVLSHPKTKKIPIRQTALTCDNRVLLALCDTGLITRWEKPAGDPGIGPDVSPCD